MTAPAGTVIPNRPLTVGELLDSATVLLRADAVRLLTASAVLAVLEQLALYPLRAHNAALPPSYFPYTDRIVWYWLALGVGFGTEVLIITVLGALAARSGPAALTGVPGAVPVPRRIGAVAALAGLSGAAGLLCALAGLLPWLLWYLFAGLAAPALVIDRRTPTTAGPGGAGPTAAGPGGFGPGGAGPGGAIPGRVLGPFAPLGPFSALGRSFALVGRGALRPGFIRLLGYLGWGMVRLALGLGGGALLRLIFQTVSPGLLTLVGMIAIVLVNCVAYATLGCLDVVLHLENRMRVEGLDLALGRALRTGAPIEPVFAVPRAPAAGPRPAVPYHHPVPRPGAIR